MSRNSKQVASNTVLVHGEPSLTMQTIYDFNDLIEKLFDFRLTRYELEVVRDDHVKYFKMASSRAMREQFCREWRMQLDMLASGSIDLEGQRLVLRGMADQGSKQGLAMAVILKQALDKRGSKLGSATKPRPDYMRARAAKLDSTLSEADLEASTEMLAYMWVNAGRDAEDLTPKAMTSVRARIENDFEDMNGEMQALFSNAEKVYDNMDEGFRSLSGPDVGAMIEGFGEVLDALGLTEESGEQGWSEGATSGSSGSNDEWSVKSGMVMNTAWNLAQKSSGGW